MDPINRLNRLIESLRQQIAESARRAETPARARAGETSRGTGPQKPGLPELRRQIQERIQALEPAGTNGQRRARRVFLESVLVWEFGDGFLSDQRYQTMLDGVQAAIENDADLDKQFTTLLYELSRR